MKIKSEITPKFLRKISNIIENKKILDPTRNNTFMCYEVSNQAFQSYATKREFEVLLKKYEVPLDGSLGYSKNKPGMFWQNKNYQRNSATIRIMFLELLALQMEENL